VVSEQAEVRGRFKDGRLDASFEVAGRRYRCFAFRASGRGGSCVCWRLYAEDGPRDERVRGLTFGVARGLDEAVADLVRAAHEHAERGDVGASRGLTFRPSPQD